MYGWDRAVITQRRFHIIKPDAARPLPAAEAASLIGTDIDETPATPNPLVADLVNFCLNAELPLEQRHAQLKALRQESARAGGLR